VIVVSRPLHGLSGNGLSPDGLSGEGRDLLAGTVMDRRPGDPVFVSNGALHE